MPVHDLKVNLCEMIIKLLGFEYCMTYCQPYLCEDTIGKLSYSRLKASNMEKILDFLFQPKYNFLATKTNFLEYSSKWRIKKNNNIYTILSLYKDKKNYHFKKEVKVTNVENTPIA